GFGYLVPGTFGLAVRFDLANFSLSTVQTLDLSGLGDFMGAHLDVFASRIYFVTIYGRVVMAYLPDFSFGEEVPYSQLATEYTLEYHPSVIASWGRFSFVWDLSTTMMVLECKYVEVLAPPKTLLQFVMLDYNNASWTDVTWTITKIDGESVVRMMMIPMNASGGSWGDASYLIERENGAVVSNGTLGPPGADSRREFQEGHRELHEFHAIAGETLYLTVARGSSTEGLGWAVTDEFYGALAAADLEAGEDEKYPSRLPFVVPGVPLQVGFGHSQQAKFVDVYVEPFAELSLSVYNRGQRGGGVQTSPESIAWVLYDHNMDALLRSGASYEATFPVHTRFSPRTGIIFSEAISTTTSSSSATTTASSTSSSQTTSSTTRSTSSSSSTTTTSPTTTSPTSSSSTSTSSTATSSTTTSTSSRSTTATSTTTLSTTVTNTTSTATTATTSSTWTTSTTTTSTTSSSTTLSSTTTTTSTSSSTTVTRTSTTTSSTLQNNLALPAAVREDSPEGAVVVATLESVLLATKSSEGAVSTSTPTGNVTVVKLSGSAASSSNSTSTTNNRVVLQINNGGAADPQNEATVEVSVPLAVVEDLAQGQNVLLTVMTIAQEVSNTLPISNTDSQSVELTSSVMELSLVLEAAGAVTVANVSDLVEPIAFRLGGSSAVPGDMCAYFDPVAQSWSTRGMDIVDQETFVSLGLGLAHEMNGTWCLTTHTSLFAVVQVIPFASMWDPEAGTLNAEGYLLAGGIVGLVVCLMLCFACGLLSRRLRPAAAGKTEIQDTKGHLHVVTFSRSRVMAETKTVVSEDEDEHEETMDAKQKVYIRWDVDPGRFMRRLNQLKGHRWVSMDLGARRETGVKGSVTKEASQSYAKRSFRNMLQGVEEEETPTHQEGNQAGSPVARQGTVASEAFLGGVESNMTNGTNEEAEQW
ncbi:unnamed protein product, partial [Symbiodinium natans]